MGHFLQTDPVGYKDQLDLYAYVGDDPMDRSDPSGLAGCGTSGGEPGRAPLSGDECQTWTKRQDQGKRDVATFRAAEANWRNHPNSANGQKFANAMTNTFGKGALSTGNLAKLDKALNGLSKFFNDPGTAKGGHYDVYRATAWSGGATILGGQVSFGARFFQGQNDSYNRVSTTHEPLHLFGFGDRQVEFPNKHYYEPSGPHTGTNTLGSTIREARRTTLTTGAA
jgi:hypothetical protein